MRVTILALCMCTLSYGLVYRKRLEPPLLDAPNARAVAPEWGTIEQRLDHFNPTDQRTWSMRYLNNSQFFQEGGPILIYLGGEWTISTGRLMTGQVYDIAEALNGYMFYTEHRYYGQSYPTEDYSTENLRYLSVDQALADIAYFIEYQKNLVPELANSKVAVVGGSYSATMATWARLKYPHLIDAAYASSAPLRAVADFFEYYEVVNYNLGLASEECVQIIKEGIELTEEQLETESGREYIDEQYFTCSPVSNEEPYRAFFFNSIAEVFAGLVQYAEVGQLATECDKLVSYDGDPLQKLSQYVKDDLGGECFGGYDEFLELYANSTLTTDAYRQWLYQSCVEFGFFQTTTSENQPFGDTFPLELYHQICIDLFGESYQESILNTAVERTNIIYGSLDPELSKIISVHGTVDPWHALGLSTDLSEDVVTVVVNGTAHCKDLNSVSDNDIDELKAAKTKAKELIAKWLTE